MPHGVPSHMQSNMPMRMSFRIAAQIPSSKTLVGVSAAVSTSHVIHPNSFKQLARSPRLGRPLNKNRAFGDSVDGGPETKCPDP